jgi:hypothetical protein
MTIRTVVALALTVAWLGCSGPEPEPAKQPVAQATAKSAPAPNAGPTTSPRRPIAPMPTVSVKQQQGEQFPPRHAETPCDRKEAGWKWVGNIVEDGHCVVGPCKCEKE